MIDDLVLAPCSIGANDGGVVRIRRDLHAHPELGHLEYRTAAKAAAHSTRLGYAVKAGPEVMVAEAMLGAPTEAAMPQPAVKPADSVRLCGGISLIETVCGDGHRIGWLRWSCEALTRTDEDPMTERSLPLAELLAKAGDGDFLRSVAEAVVQLLIETD